jgi:hypothetical protein
MNQTRQVMCAIKQSIFLDVYALTACLVCLISTVSGCCKKRENALEDVALVAGTHRHLKIIDCLRPALFASLVL